MAQQVDLGRGAFGKVRSFWVGLGLTVVTLGIYNAVWYYLLNKELKDIGSAKGDSRLAASSPTRSVFALVFGYFVIVPPFISVYRFGHRIRRSQELAGIDAPDAIDPTMAFLLWFPGGLLLVPLFFYYWYVTKHQNAAIRATAGLPAWQESGSAISVGLGAS